MGGEKKKKELGFLDVLHPWLVGWWEESLVVVVTFIEEIRGGERLILVVGSSITWCRVEACSGCLLADETGGTMMVVLGNHCYEVIGGRNNILTLFFKNLIQFGPPHYIYNLNKYGEGSLESYSSHRQSKLWFYQLLLLPPAVEISVCNNLSAKASTALIRGFFFLALFFSFPLNPKQPLYHSSATATSA